MVNDLKQVVRPGVSLRAKHPHETFGRYVGSLGQRPKTNRRVDIVAEHGFAGFQVTGKQGINTLLKHGLAKLGVLPGVFQQGSAYSLVMAMASPLSFPPLLLLPARPSRPNVGLRKPRF